MARVSHKKIKQLVAQKQKTITDRQFFSSRLLAAHFEDMAAAQTRRYGYRRRVSVQTVWEPKNENSACTNNDVIWINAGHSVVTKLKSRQDRYNLVCGLFAHELGHLLYTDFLGSQSHDRSFIAGSWYPSPPLLMTHTERANEADIWDYCKESPEHMLAFLRMSHSVHNIIEDGYIESKMLNRYPGVLGTNLDYLRTVEFEDMQTLTQLIEEEEDDRIWPTVMQLILSYVLWGEIKYGDESTSDKRVQIVFSLLSELDRGMMSTTPSDRWSVVNITLIRCWRYVKEFLEYCEELSKTATASGTGTTCAELVSRIVSALAGMSSEGSGTTAPVKEAGAEETPASAGAKRSVTAKLAAETANEDEADDDKAGGASGGEEKGKDDEAAEEEGSATAAPDPTASGDESSGASAEGAESEESVPAEAGSGDASSAREVSEKEGGRIPAHQTSKLSEPTGGGVEKDDEYTGTGYAGAASDIDRLLESMAERAVTTQLEKERTKELNELAQAISYGNIHAGVKIKIHRMAEVTDKLKEDYKEICAPLLRISKALQKSIAQQLQDKRRGGKQTGLLMGRRLDVHALSRNDGRAFYKNALPNETPELAVGLLLDESGSMYGYDRATYARASAIILYNFCRSMNIPVMVYGHSTSGGTVDLYSYAEFDAIDKDDCYRLMDISARNSNRDGAALRFVAEQLSKRPEDIKMLILVSDGQPADIGYGGSAAEEDLRGIKQEYQRKGILLVAAAIGSDKENIERIYRDSFLDITDLSKLPITLTSVVKRFIRV